jgi:hypothetical protein
MRLKSATFVYETDGGTWDVLFVGHQVKLWMTCQTSSSGVLVVENANRQWKPCQSHAQDLIRMHTQQPARCNQAKQRVAATRPVLRVVSAR